jgi:T5orf172 domain
MEKRMIYFVQGQATGLIKIGMTHNMRKRLRAIQAHSPDVLTILAIIPDEYDDGRYHFDFRESWSHGEWFEPTAELISFIASLPKSSECGEGPYTVGNLHVGFIGDVHSSQPRTKLRRPRVESTQTKFNNCYEAYRDMQREIGGCEATRWLKPTLRQNSSLRAAFIKDIDKVIRAKKFSTTHKVEASGVKMRLMFDPKNKNVEPLWMENLTLSTEKGKPFVPDEQFMKEDVHAN